jgi:hypothetical protein
MVGSKDRMLWFRVAQTVGFVAYVVAMRLPVPAIMLVCALVSSPLRLIGQHVILSSPASVASKKVALSALALSGYENRR